MTLIFDHQDPLLPPVDERRYPQSSDAQMRLSNSFVRYKDVPIWMNAVIDDKYIEAFTLDSFTSGYLHFNDENIDVSNIPVGWVNTVSSLPVHLLRVPHRAQKQGFGPQEAAQFVPFTDPEIGSHVSFHRDHSTKGLSIWTIGNTLLGKFLPIIDLVDQPCGGPMSSEWCIAAPKTSDKKRRNSIFTLFHDSYSIGYYDHTNRKFSFRPGTLTKTRRRTLNEICITNGGGYVIEELLD